MERIQIIAQERSIVPIGVEIGGNGIDPRRGGFGDFRIIERLITDAENERALAVRANEIVNALVVARGGEREEFAHDFDAGASGFEPKLPALFEGIPIFGELDIKI